MEKTFIPEDNSVASIKIREQIIRDFYREWKERNPSQRKFNLSLKEYINIRMVSIIETSEHAAKNYLSTLAVLQLDAILIGAKKKSVKKPKEGNKNQKPFEKMFSAMNMEYNPIHNYDSHEVYSGSSSESGNVGTTDVRTGTMSETVDQDTTNNNSDANTSNTEDDGSVINMVSAFDSTDTVVHDSSTTENTTNVNETNVSTGSGTMDQTTNTSSTDSNVVNTDSSKEITDGHTIDKSGNIGVTTSQQMLESELSLRLKNIYDIMASEFLKAMTLRVY